MVERVKVKTIATYGGHNVKQNKSVDITFKCEYGELSQYIKLIQFLNENVDITIKQSDEPAEKLGTFMVREIRIDHDGEGVLKFNSMIDHAECQLFHKLAGNEPFKIMFEAEIDNEVEGEEEDE